MDISTADELKKKEAIYLTKEREVRSRAMDNQQVQNFRHKMVKFYVNKDNNKCEGNVSCNSNANADKINAIV